MLDRMLIGFGACNPTACNPNLHPMSVFSSSSRPHASVASGSGSGSGSTRCCVRVLCMCAVSVCLCAVYVASESTRCCVRVHQFDPAFTRSCHRHGPSMHAVPCGLCYALIGGACDSAVTVLCYYCVLCCVCVLCLCAGSVCCVCVRCPCAVCLCAVSMCYVCVLCMCAVWPRCSTQLNVSR